MVAVAVLKNAARVAADEVRAVMVETVDHAVRAETAGHAVRVVARIVDHVIVDRAVMGRAAMEIVDPVLNMRVVVISIVIVSVGVISNPKVAVIHNSLDTFRKPMVVHLSVMVEAESRADIRAADVIQAIAIVIVDRAVRVNNVMGRVAVDRAEIIADVVASMAGVRRVPNNVMVNVPAGRVRRKPQWLRAKALAQKSRASSRSCSEKNPKAQLSVA